MSDAPLLPFPPLPPVLHSRTLEASSRKIDPVAVTSLVTALLAIPLIPIILGLLGINRTGKDGRAGQGIAIAGFLLGIVGTIAWVAAGVALLLVPIVTRMQFAEFSDSLGAKDTAGIAAVSNPASTQESEKPAAIPDDDRVCGLRVNDLEDYTSYLGYGVLSGIEGAAAGLSVKSDTFEAESVDQVRSAIEGFVDKGCSVIVGNGRGVAEALSAAALASPEVHFVSVNAEMPQAYPNTVSIFFDLSESYYLAGYAAAASSGTGIIGVIVGTDVPLAEKYGESFREGVEYYNQTANAWVTVVQRDSGSDDGLDLTQRQDVRAATESLRDEGADIIAPLTGLASVGSMDVADAAEDMGLVWNEHWNAGFDSASSSRILVDILGNSSTTVAQVVMDIATKGRVADPYFARQSTGGVITTLDPAYTGYVPAGLDDELWQMSRDLQADRAS